MRLKNIQSDILKAIRGKLTTSAFSSKMGYRFNQYARWEKGERRLLWSDFISICRIRHLPIKEQASVYLGFAGDLDDTASFTKAVVSGHSIDEVSKATKISRSKISRWVNGKAEPAFDDMFALLNWVINVLSFFEPLVNLEQIPALASDFKKFKVQRETVYALPYLDALKEALTVDEYARAPKHDSKILARIAGLPVDVIDRSLIALVESDQAEKKGGKYLMNEIGVDYRADKRRMANILTHWLRETTDVVEKSQGGIPNSLAGFSVFGLSRDAHEKAQTLVREFVRGMHAIGSEDQGPKEKVYAFTVAYIDTERFGE